MMIDNLSDGRIAVYLDVNDILANGARPYIDLMSSFYKFQSASDSLDNCAVSYKIGTYTASSDTCGGYTSIDRLLGLNFYDMSGPV